MEMRLNRSAASTLNDVMELANVPEIPILLGVIFLIAGAAMRIFPPRKINALYGYRTPRSMSSGTRWHFAQKFAAYKLMESGIVLALVSLPFAFFKLPDPWRDWIGIAAIASAILYPVISTETAIKKHHPNP
ncbi:MAG: SdpI family protein [Chitinophagaceae bacterium]|nr:MAG: SdpI family protein [Chitinophagaceae bacterium]